VLGAFLTVKTLLAPHSNGSKFSPLGDVLTIIKQDIKTQDMKREVREIRETARKIAVSKEAARHLRLTPVNPLRA
jgi:hypothetical protein